MARAIDLAARQWPGEPRSRLLLRLVDAGSVLLTQQENRASKARQRAVRHTSGKYPDAFDPDHLARLREDWPD